MSIETGERSSQLHVRPIQDSDRGLWASYWKEYNTFEGKILAAASPENTKARWHELHDPNSSIKGIMAIVDAKPIGFAHYILKPETADLKDSLYMEDIYVSPAFSNRGIAKAMIEWQRQEANRQNLTRFYWICYDNNPNAQAVYDKIAKRAERVGVRGQIYVLDLSKPVGQKPATPTLQKVSVRKRDYSQLKPSPLESQPAECKSSQIQRARRTFPEP